MATHEIPEAEWSAFFQTFSARRKGATVTVETADPQKGPRKEESNVPLAAITYADGAVTVAFEGGATHAITSAKAVYHKGAAGLMSDEVNHDEIIEVTSADNPPVTQLHFAAR